MLTGAWVYVVALVASFIVATVATPAGVSGAVLLLPFQVGVLGTPSPSVTPTNLLYNVVATPGALCRYWRQRQTGGRLTRLLILGTLPGVIVGSIVRVELELGEDWRMTDQRRLAGPLYEGVPYEYGAVALSGAVVFTAGACPLDADGNVVGAGSRSTQARVALKNLLFALDRYGAGPEHLVKTTVYVVGDRLDLVEAWEVVAEDLAPYRPPSTLLGVSALGYPGQLVEIEGIAALPGAR